MLISNKLHSFRNFRTQIYKYFFIFQYLFQLYIQQKLHYIVKFKEMNDIELITLKSNSHNN
jgi:hypothetical protein